MDFWIDQYDSELDAALDVAIKIARGEYDEEVARILNEMKAGQFTTAGLIKQFCELVMIFDLKSLGRHDGSGLSDKVIAFLDRLRHSNFVEDDANILASVIMKLAEPDERIVRETETAQSKFDCTQFRPRFVHPKIARIARNLHPGIEKIYQQIS